MITNPIAFSYFVADGTTTEFSYAFNGTTGFDTKVASEVKAAVLNPDNTRDLNPNFAVMQDAYGNLSGTIKFASAPVEGAIILIARQTEITQEMSIATSSGFDAKALEKALDKLTKIAQELNLHGRQKTLQLDLFQEIAFALQKLSAENQGQYLFVDYANKQIKAGLFLSVSNGQFSVSEDGQTWINLPKSSTIQEFRVVELQNPDRKSLEYRVGENWYSAASGFAHNDFGGRDVANAHPISAITGLREELDSDSAQLQDHIGNTDNPHSVTKDQVGLGNVDNTSDSDKPVSTAVQTALDDKVGKSGDTMTGDLNMDNANITLKTGAGTAEIRAGTDGSLDVYADGATLSSWRFAKDRIVGGLDGEGKEVGSETQPMNTVWVEKLNNAIVPDETGTLAMAADVATVSNDLGELGNQVSGIEAKIPGAASASNQLVTASDLSGKQDALTAGENITIENNVISATGGGGSYTLPPATADTLGGIKVGANLSITSDGTLSAESGGGTAEPWAVKADLPAGYTMEGSPIIDFGELPDGSYEFMYQVIAAPDGVVRPITYGVTFNILQGGFNGTIYWAFDGETFLPDGYYLNAPMSIDLYLARSDDTTRVIVASYSEIWNSMLPYMGTHPDGFKDCFKVSKIKEIQTGAEYMPSITIYDGPQDVVSLYPSLSFDIQPIILPDLIPNPPTPPTPSGQSISSWERISADPWDGYVVLYGVEDSFGAINMRGDVVVKLDAYNNPPPDATADPSVSIGHMLFTVNTWGTRGGTSITVKEKTGVFEQRQLNAAFSADYNGIAGVWLDAGIEADGVLMAANTYGNFARIVSVIGKPAEPKSLFTVPIPVITAGGGSGGAEVHGLRGDYGVQYGIVNYTGDTVASINIDSGNIDVMAGVQLKVPGNGNLIQIASSDTHQVTSTTDFTLFYADGTYLEADVYYQTDTPADNGGERYQAWWNGTTWQFRSNDTGNVFRELANATPILDAHFTGGALTRLDFAPYTLLEADVVATKNYVDNKSGTQLGIGGIVSSLLPQEDAGLHLLDGSVLSGDGVYQAFVEYMARLYWTGTLAMTSFVPETEWQASVAQYGVCGKFVYDSVANTIRLPKITGLVEGTLDVDALGDLVQAGLPNITGSHDVYGQWANISNYTGAFYSTNTSYKSGSAGSYDTVKRANFDASRSSSIYGNSTTVQPQTIKGFLYIVVGTSVKPQYQVDVDNIVTDLNGKAGTDLANLNVSGQAVCASLAMPSNRVDSLTLGASGARYTAPADGYFTILISDGSYIEFAPQDGEICGTSTTLAGGGWGRMTIPVRKGVEVTVFYGEAPTVEGFKFVYANGAQ